jgi:hypothetical protein
LVGGNNRGKEGEKPIILGLGFGREGRPKEELDRGQSEKAQETCFNEGDPTTLES